MLSYNIFPRDTGSRVSICVLKLYLAMQRGCRNPRATHTHTLVFSDKIQYQEGTTHPSRTVKESRLLETLFSNSSGSWRSTHFTNFNRQGWGCQNKPQERVLWLSTGTWILDPLLTSYILALVSDCSCMWGQAVPVCSCWDLSLPVREQLAQMPTEQERQSPLSAQQILLSVAAGKGSTRKVFLKFAPTSLNGGNLTRS